MSNLDSNKNLAAVGCILLLLSFIPAVGWFFGLIGVVLLLMGIKGLSVYYQDNSIYQNAFSGVIFYVIALIAIGVAGGGLAFGGMFNRSAGGIFGLGLSIIFFVGALIVAFVFFLIASSRIRRSMQGLARKSGEQLFETAGLLFFIGAILSIVVVGLAILLAAWVLALIAFFSIKLPSQAAPQPYVSTQTTPSVQATKFCPYCGAPADSTATFCSRCGRQLPPA